MIVIFLIVAFATASGSNDTILVKSLAFLNDPKPVISVNEENQAILKHELAQPVMTEEEKWLKAFEADLKTSIAVRKNRGRVAAVVSQQGPPIYYTHICPLLELFKHTPIENLKCDRRLTETIKGTKEVSISVINLATVMTTIKGCLCKKYTVYKGCTSWFFGAVTKTREVVYNTPTPEECRTQCRKDHDQVKSGSRSSDEGSYRCKWPVHNTVSTTIVETASVFVTYETLTKRFHSGIFHGGSCLIDQCQVSKPNIFVLRQPPEEHCSYTSTAETFRYQTNQGNMTVLESKSTNLQYPVMGGCVIKKCTTQILTIPSGHLFVIPSSLDLNMTHCDMRTYRLPSRSEIPPKVEKSWEDLYELYDRCLMKRQIIRNALWSNVPLDTSLLKEFNQDSGLRMSESLIKYLILNNQLLSASCPLTIYNDLEWRNHDLWAVRRGEKVIGCLDARLDIVFQGFCRPYNSTMAYHALGTWEFKFDSNGTLFATPKEYSVVNFIKTITGVWFGNEVVQEALAENRNPIIEDPSFDNNPSKSDIDSKGVKFKWPNLFTGLTSFFLITVVIVVLLILFCCVCKIRRVHPTEYIPLNQINTRPH